MTNKKRTLESVADQTVEMWENGNPSKEIVDVIAKEVGGIVCDTPMREKAAGMYGIEAFHPFNLANVDVNVVRNLCRAIHDFGRSRFAAYKTVLMSEGIFNQEVRTAVWMDYIGITECGVRRAWLDYYLKLYVSMQAEGFRLIRNICPDIIGHVNRAYNASTRLWQAFEADNLAQFELVRTIEGTRLSKTFVRDMLKKNGQGKHILANLISTEKEISPAFPFDEILFYVCASSIWPWKSITVVRAILDVAPEIITAVDPFGLTPLDYIFFNLRVGEDQWRAIGSGRDFEINCFCKWDALACALIKSGCNPHHKNKYGVSALDIRRQMHSYGAMRQDWKSDGCKIACDTMQILRDARIESAKKSFWSHGKCAVPIVRQGAS